MVIKIVVVACLDLTSLLTIFQSYHDGVTLVATGSSILTFIVSLKYHTSDT